MEICCSSRYMPIQTGNQTLKKKEMIIIRIIVSFAILSSLGLLRAKF